MTELMTPLQVAKLFGQHRNTIYRYIRKREFTVPIIRVGLKKAIRFDRKDIEDYLEKNKEANNRIFKPAVWEGEDD